jgi:tyrosyl-DNA phosphodiesterase 1
VSQIREAGRRRAAPHIKTYVRFSDASKTEIDWALVTSANISKQAWGDAINAAGEVRICSYELGVVVWPELYGEGAKMQPTFKQDMPGTEDPSGTGAKVS